MKQNQYYSKRTMNLKQLRRDLENQGGLHVNYYSKIAIIYVEISLTGYKDWSVIYYKSFKEISFYKAATNWEVIKILNKLLKEL